MVPNLVTCQSDAVAATATVTFVAERLRTTARVTLGAGVAPTLLAIARQHGVPILFTCEVGGCGACLVRVVPATDATQPVALTDSEEFLLPVLARQSVSAGKGEEPRSPAGCLRLACQYVVGPGEITVAFSDAMAAR